LVSKRFHIVLFLIVLALPLFALSIGDAVPGLTESQITVLKNGGLLKGESFEDDVKVFIPVGSIGMQHLLEALEKPESFTVVSLTFLPYPDAMRTMTEEERQVSIFNTMRSISTQEGITYISHRAGNKPKELIEKSWYLETPKSRSSMPDPVSTSVPPTAEYIVYQKDSSFGSNIYRHRYTTSATEIFVNVVNLETMRVFGIFKAVDKEQLAIAMATTQVDEGLLLVAMATIEGRDPQVKVLGISVDLPSSFTRRTTALGEWFADQLNKQ